MADPDGTVNDRSEDGRIVVVGGGLCGLLTGMLLANDGHHVTVLERDPAPPPQDPRDAWDHWERTSIRQFHMGHFFLPRFRSELAEHLPGVLSAVRDAGALSTNPIGGIPDSITGGWREGDERFESLTGRRPVMEAVVANCAAATERLEVRRGVVVTKLLTGAAVDAASGVADSSAAGPVHVVGIETEDGEVLAADLVVDATGRNSALPRLLVAAGATAPVDEADDSGFVYYGRTYASDDGSVPASLGGGLQAYGSISTLTLAADNGTWQLALVASGRDAAMRKTRNEDTFLEVWRSYPLVAHWADGKPISDVAVMANLEDRIRAFVVDGAPVATGIAAVGDSWACTNPSVGRGASIALVHAVALRDHLREGLPTASDPVSWSLAWDRRTAETVEPFFRDTVEADRHRLGQIEAAIDRREYVSDDPTHAFSEALAGVAFRDPDLLRAWLDSFMLHRTQDDLMSDDALVTRALGLAAANTDEPAPGLDRAQLEALLATTP
jgi:2-polyprenyl-6-methoxyphenol hydroxylase-like FAD-dependent oxidoreductase